MRRFIIGVDIGGTTVKLGKFTLEGDLIKKWTIRTDLTNHGVNILNDIASSIKNEISLSEIKGIGFGVPGPIKDNIALNCVNLGWKNINIKIKFEEILGDSKIEIRAGNDATLAAAGEMYKGIAKGYNNVVLFTLGTGVGGGIIYHNQLVEGYNGVGGELGHIKTDNEHNFKCNCGKSGCLETVSSAKGIVKLAQYNLDKYPENSILRRFNNFSAKKVFDLAKQGDYIAEKTIDESMKYLAQAMAAVSFTVNPAIIVIGGGISNAGNYLIEKIEKHYYNMVNPFITHTNFAIATLGNDAGIYGCCYLVK